MLQSGVAVEDALVQYLVSHTSASMMCEQLDRTETMCLALDVALGGPENRGAQSNASYTMLRNNIV